MSMPLDLEGVDDLVLCGINIVGGANNISLFDSRRVTILGGRLMSPKGEPGADNHNLLLNNTRNVVVRDVLMGSVRPRGDAISVYNSSRVVIDGVRISGPFDMKTDKAADIVIDGTGKGGHGDIIRNVRVKKIVIAAGGFHRLENVRAVTVEISGAAYSGNPRRLVHDITIRHSIIKHLWIDGQTVKRVMRIAA